MPDSERFKGFMHPLVDDPKFEVPEEEEETEIFVPPVPPVARKNYLVGDVKFGEPQKKRGSILPSELTVNENPTPDQDGQYGLQIEQR